MKNLDLIEVVQKRKKFTEQIKQGYKSELNLLEQVYELGKSMVKNSQNVPIEQNLFRGLLKVALVRTVNRIESIAFLMLVGNSVDCAMIFRAIFEELINILYIEKESELRALLYSRHEITPYLKFLKRKKENQSNCIDELDKKISSNTQKLSLFDSEINEKFPGTKPSNGPDWSGRKIRNMAEDVGLGNAYDTMYWEISGISHSSASSALFFIKNVEGKGLVPKFYPNDEISNRVSRATAFYSLYILSVVNRNFKLGKDRAINQLNKKIKTAFGYS